MMGPEFRLRSFKHSISSVTSPPLPLRSTRVKLKLLSASASWASSDDEAATHWNPRARRKPRSPSWVAASTSTTSALRSVIALLSFGQSRVCIAREEYWQMPYQHPRADGGGAMLLIFRRNLWRLLMYQDS